MGFTSVQLYNFRNLVNGEIDTNGPEVFLVGENGQGKSNFLEAVYLLCFGSSFRTRNNRLLVRKEEKEMSLRGRFSLPPEEDLMTELKMREGQKEIFLNGKKIGDRKELITTIPCIIFSHEDISYINGPPDTRRRFINQTMTLFNPLFIDTLRSYTKVLKMRNSELKNPRGTPLEIYDHQLADLGIDLQQARSRAIDEFNETFQEIHRRVEGEAGRNGSPEPVRMTYRPSWKKIGKTGDVTAVLEAAREQDRELGFTRYGPHRDRIVFTRSGRDYSQTASTGQLRLLSLALKAAQAAFFHAKTGRDPVLLLDDVLLELDGERKKAFVQVLPRYEQAFFTFLPDEHYHRFYQREGTLVYTVKEGRISG